jgi:hypothetical protein
MAKLKASAKLLENVRLVTENGRGHSVVCDLSELQEEPTLAQHL